MGEVVNSTTCAPIGVSELHAHVAEAAEADDADLLALADFPVAQRRIGGDAGAQQRRSSGEVEVLRNPQDERLVHDDRLGVAAVRHAAQMLSRLL